MADRMPPILALVAAGAMIYVLVILFIGLPIVNATITDNASYADLARGTPATAMLWRIYAYSWVAVEAGVAVGTILILAQRWLLRHTTSTGRAALSVIALRGEFWACVLAMVGCAAITVSHVAMHKIGQSEALREFARADSVKFAGATILFVIFTFYLAKETLRWRLTDVAKICSDYYVDVHLEAIKREDLEGAKEAIQKACEVYPASVRAWAVRSHFANVDLSNRDDAAVFLDRATALVGQGGSVSDEDKSNYEFFLGTFLLSQENYREAIKHLSRSLDLIYCKERAEYLDKVKRSTAGMAR